MVLSGLEEARGVRCGEAAFAMRETRWRVDLLPCRLGGGAGSNQDVERQRRGGGGCGLLAATEKVRADCF